MKFQAIICVGARAYTVNLGEDLQFKHALDALKFIREGLLTDGVFSNDGKEALEINCLDKYDSIRVVEWVDMPQLPAVEPAEADQVTEGAKEYALANIAGFNYLAQPMDVSLLVYYASNDHKVLMPSVINGSHAHGYMSEKNVVELMHKIAQQRLQLTPDGYTVLLYPGPITDMEDAIEYLREWATYRDSGYVFAPKRKNAKAFHGWNEKE